MSGGPVPLPADCAPASPGLRALLEAIRADGQLARWLEVHCPQPGKRQHPKFAADLTAAVCFDALQAGQCEWLDSRQTRHLLMIIFHFGFQLTH